MGFVSKTTRLLEKQTTHHHFMGLLCTFELLSNIAKGKFKFKSKFKPIGTNEMCCLLSECSHCKIEKRCDKLQMGILHFANTWKPTISSFGVGEVNKKRMGQKQKDT